ncbi:GAF domain-containing protein [Halobacterium rubrum]|uniref:GAF domain-containing protein n=1 Tax=Halobacterium TaxID=2239 RepID=UPI001EFFF931|nr:MULTISPECIES: GAF domain-containing protein [Halobacterium]MDH5019251.1 GAF domain-containing protein [Halobacterium rubrum]
MILCVDGDADAREATRRALADAGFQTAGSGTVDGALDVLADGGVDCVVTEHNLPDGTGLELIRTARDHAPDAACILFTETPLDDIDTAAFGDTVAEYLHRGSDTAHDDLVGLVEHSLAFLSQTAYPLPDDEDARLAALDRYAVDAEGLRDALDRLTDLAGELFGVATATVGLLDAHEEEFVACHGSVFDTLERDATVCTYAILDDDVTVVENVQDDPRFADNDTLREAELRFYAGAPLVTPDGHRIGVFCLHDDEPGTFSERDRELLQSFAAEAMDQFELRRRAAEDTATTTPAAGSGGDGGE